MATVQSSDRRFWAFAEKRIGWLTLCLGAAGAIVAAATYSSKAGVGVAVGALLAWVNWAWLREGLDALVAVSTAEPSGLKPRIRRRTYAKLIARYILIGLIIYVIFSLFSVPVVSVLLGLLALGAATILEGMLETFFRSR